jgi:hypothetical protein
MATTAPTAVGSEGTTPTRARRTDGLVGNRLMLAGVVLYLCEFIGILASRVDTMPVLPGSSLHQILSAYDGQVGATGFLVGWFSLVLPGRILLALGLRRAVLDSQPTGAVRPRVRGALLDWAVALMAVGVATEVVSGAVLAGAAASAARGDSGDVFALDRVGHYLQVAGYCPTGTALVVLAAAMWRSGVFPRVLTGAALGTAAVQAVSGSLLSAPSMASLQDGLTAFNLLDMLVLLWIGVLVFRRTPDRLFEGTAGDQSCG